MTISGRQAEVHYWSRYDAGACPMRLRVRVLSLDNNCAFVESLATVPVDLKSVLDDPTSDDPYMQNPFDVGGMHTERGAILRVPLVNLSLLPDGTQL